MEAPRVFHVAYSHVAVCMLRLAVSGAERVAVSVWILSVMLEDLSGKSTGVGLVLICKKSIQTLTKQSQDTRRGRSRDP